MSPLRRAVGNRVPPRFANLARAIVRGADQLAGLPLSPFRRGAVAMFHVGRCGSSVLGENGLLAEWPSSSAPMKNSTVPRSGCA